MLQIGKQGGLQITRWQAALLSTEGKLVLCAALLQLRGIGHRQCQSLQNPGADLTTGTNHKAIVQFIQ